MYNIWYNDMVETYKIVNKILKPVQNALVLSHEFIDERVVEMVYDNGITIVLDYNTSVITVDNGAEQYTVDFENDQVTTDSGVITVAEFVKD